jgi:tetratricopeptide (TPR) repeat protein
LGLDPKFIKAFMRRATAKFELKNFEGAIEDLRAALEIEPNNATVKTDLDAAITAFNETKAKQQLEQRKRDAARMSPAASNVGATQKTTSNKVEEFELPEPEIKSALPVEKKPAATQIEEKKLTQPMQEPPKYDIKAPTSAPKSFYMFEQAYASLGGRTELLSHYFDVRLPSGALEFCLGRFYHLFSHICDILTPF